MATLATVAAIHAIGIYALVNGLGGVIVTMIERHNPIARNIEVQMPLPQVIPTPKPAPDTPLTIPQTRVDLTPLPSTLPQLPLTPTMPTPWAGSTAIPTPDVPTAPPTPQVRHGDPVTARPMGRPGDWATPEDYPSVDLNAEHEGVTHFSLSIGADGRVSGCTVTGSSGWPGLDGATCKLIMKRARFSPALDESGQATTGGFASAIRWTIPR
jgi:protein TonB